MNLIQKSLLLILLMAATFWSCQKEATPTKTTGHIYCVIQDSTPKRVSQYFIKLIQQGATLKESDPPMSEYNPTIDLGEWNPGTYDITGRFQYEHGSGGGLYPSMNAEKGVQVTAGKDVTVTLDNWR